MRSHLHIFATWLFLLLALPYSANAADDFHSLRAEIQAANRAGSGAITLSANIRLTGELPPITSAISIDGTGHSISGDEQFRIFDVNGGQLSLKSLALADGYSDGDGGAIRLRGAGSLVADNVAFRGNFAQRGGVVASLSARASIAISGGVFRANSAELQGGVFFLQGGSASINRSSFVDNFSERAWGGVFHASNSQLSVSNSTFSGNEGLAGGVLAQMSGRASFTHVTMIDNESDYLGGDAIYRYGGAVSLFNSIVHSRGPIEDCNGGLSESAGNLSADGTCADIPSGGLLLGDLTGALAYYPLQDGSPALDAALEGFCPDIDQLGHARPQGAGCDIGAIESGDARTLPPPRVPPPACPLFDQIVAANTDAEAGGCPAGKGHDTISLTRDISLGALLPSITSDITIEGNGHSISGAGRFRIFSVVAGTLTLNDLTLANGRVAANGKGGALMLQALGKAVVNDSRFIGNMAKEGGAIWVASPGSRLTIKGSSFVNNRTSNHGAGGAIVLEGGTVTIEGSSFVDNQSDRVGGAIATWSAGEMQVQNSSFSGNRAQTGGAIYSGGAPLSLRHVTLAHNRAEAGHAIALFEDYPARVELVNSIVTGGSGDGLCAGPPLQRSQGNLISDGSCAAPAGEDAMLAELTGSPAYHPLKPGSPAIDSADPAYCPAADQLGRTRPAGAGCDIGAIEFASADEAAPACHVTTTRVLNLRDSPGGKRIGSVPKNATFTMSARSDQWFRVEQRGVTGWISADYVITQGDCN